MGVTYLEGTLLGPSGVEESLHLLVDSGARYTLLPMPVWQSLGLESKRELTFTLADGTTVQRRVSECHISLEHGDTHTSDYGRAR